MSGEGESGTPAEDVLFVHCTVSASTQERAIV